MDDVDVSPLGLCLVTATSRHWACVTVDFLPYTGQVRGEVWSRPQTRRPGEQVPPSLERQQGDARRRASGRWQEEASHRRDCAVRQGTVSRIFGGGMAPAELQDAEPVPQRRAARRAPGRGSARHVWRERHGRADGLYSETHQHSRGVLPPQPLLNHVRGAGASGYDAEGRTLGYADLMKNKEGQVCPTYKEAAMQLG